MNKIWSITCKYNGFLHHCIERISASVLFLDGELTAFSFIHRRDSLTLEWTCKLGKGDGVAGFRKGLSAKRDWPVLI